ncbi:MAG: hypothetical protein MI741_12795 [Rhodospirillales bacterium]|nr:hypothetical protein [Rhodospirillales bacterium]
MESIEVGQRVRIPVHLLGGPFPDQVLAMIRFDGKDVSGVIGKDEVVGMEGRNGFVRGEVAKLKGESVVLKVPKGLSGGTFSRSGKATLPLDWARANLVADTDA